MATYPGMSLKGEVRESISLDEDDLSDVEDEVFIRDGKNSYKLSEELQIKRPLMAPRRKVGKPDITARLRTRPPCKAFCKPCCYVFLALSILIGLIALVVVLVSIFPLPLDKFKDWIISQSHPSKSARLHSKLLPCSNLKVTDVWATKLSILTTESPVRTLDINRDSIEDVIFGFGTGYNYDILPEEKFCPIFLGVAPPCEGGVIALDGLTGEIVWRYWTNDTIFTVHCTTDLNDDGLADCLALGVEGSIFALDSRNGSLIWQHNPSAIGVFVANFIPDQNRDNVSDVLSSHSSLDGNEGHLVLFSGRTGQELKSMKTPNGARTFFMPQILKNGTENWVIFGTGSPATPGNLSAAILETIVNGNTADARTLYADKYSGVFTQAILVDITGDKVADIVIAMYNSTVIAIDGANFGRIWNYTLPNSLTNVVPTPGYFNDDNVTDFLIIYEKYDNILNYNYTKTFILDGKTGKPVYDKPISGSLTSQMGGLTLRMEGFGFDMFLFWTMECTNADIYKNQEIPSKVQHSDLISDVCRDDLNSTSILKLNTLSQFDQPPGFLIYKSANRSSIEFDNVKSPLKQIKDYYLQHPKPQMTDRRGQSEIGENYSVDPGLNTARKHGSDIFRHKDNRQGLVKLDYRNPERVMETAGDVDPDYSWDTRQNYMNNELPGQGIDPEYGNFNPEEMSDPSNLFNQNQMLLDGANSKNTRDPRNPESPDHYREKMEKTSGKSPKNGIYNYKNVRMARNRLLHDLNDPPTEILRDTYFKNRENQLTRSKFEQRDINSHIDKMKEKEEIAKIIEEEKKRAINGSFNLWELESEKEVQDKANRFWREKRDANFTLNGIKRISSVGAIMKSLNSTTNNSLDLVFVTYWQPIRNPNWFKKEMADCIEAKLSNASKAQTYQSNTKEEQLNLFKRECLNEQENFEREVPYLHNLDKLSLGQMTVYRIRIECRCTKDSVDSSEKCAKFLPENQQNWGTFLGRAGDGFFETRN